MFFFKQKINFFSLTVFFLGFSSIAAQIIYIREFLTIFFGSEIIIGIVLADWMICTAAGSRFALVLPKRVKSEFILACLHILLAVISPFGIFALRLIFGLLLPAGTEMGLTGIILLSLAVTLPYCVISGMMFSVYASLGAEKKHIIRIYYIDTLGFAAGGILISLIFVLWLRNLEMMIISAFPNLAAAVVIFVRLQKRRGIYITIAIALLLAGALMFGAEDYSKSFLFRGQSLIYQKDTPHGNIAVTQSGSQLNCFENGGLLFSTGNIEECEENVHFVMLRHPGPRNILIISGGNPCIISEIMKYKPEHVDYMEINGDLLEAEKKYIPGIRFDDVNVINSDARFFIRKQAGNFGIRYDVVLINMALPSTAQYNRYFTLEFFGELKRVLNPEAIISLSIPVSSNYAGREASELFSGIFNTLGHVFDEVEIYPGSRMFFLASDFKFPLEIIPLLERGSIENLYVNKYYLDEGSILQRADRFRAEIDTNAPLNRDFKPVSYMSAMNYWQSLFGENRAMVIIFIYMIIILFFLFFSGFDSASMMLAGAGYAAMSSQILIIIGFQIVYGNIYQLAGLLITVFMLGLAAGANLYKKYKPVKLFLNPLLIAANCISIPYIIETAGKMLLPEAAVFAIFIVISLIISILTGIQFALSAQFSSLSGKTAAGILYSSDLAGSAAAALIVSAYILPVAGFNSAGIIAGAVSLATIIFPVLTKMRHR